MLSHLILFYLQNITREIKCVYKYSAAQLGLPRYSYLSSPPRVFVRTLSSFLFSYRIDQSRSAGMRNETRQDGRKWNERRQKGMKEEKKREREDVFL